MLRTNSLKVLIAGGGIGGLTALLALRTRGIDAQLFEQAEAFRQVGAGIQLSSNATRILRSLGLGEALARKERDYAPVLPPGEVPTQARVMWFDDEATGGVVLELRATDRIGMLHRVAEALEGCDAQVQWARVATLGSSVVDSFGIRCRREDGPTAERRRQIESAVLAAAR